MIKRFLDWLLRRGKWSTTPSRCIRCSRIVEERGQDICYRCRWERA